MKKTIDIIVKGLIYLTFFVPLIVVPSSFIFPFIVPKILLFRSLATLALGGYVLLLIINWREYRPRLTLLNITLFAFLLSFTISTFVGVDSYHSFWDNHERMLGLFTIFFYVVYYYICGSVFKNWVEWRTALTIFLFAGSVVMLIGLLQVKNPEMLLNRGNERVASTLGNPIYVGGYGLFLTFVAFLLFIKEKSKWWRITEGLLGILALLGMFFSGTRGSMLGFGAGAGVALIGYSIILRERPKVRQALLAVIGLLILSLGVMYYYRRTDFVKSIPALGRTLNTSFTDLKATPRWIAWRIAVQSFEDRPVFGWGPNNYFYAFNQHYNPKSLNFGYGETWFDNAHNIIVNTLAVQGGAGIIIYLGVFAVGIISLWKNKELRHSNPHAVVIGSAFLVAHLIGNVTVFENPTSYLYFMFWLAMVNRLSVNQNIGNSVEERQKPPTDQKHNFKHPISKIPYPDRRFGLGTISAVSAVALISVFLFNIQPARANQKTLFAMRQFSADPILGVAAMKQALAFSSPHIDDIRSDLARVAVQALEGHRDKLGKDRSNEIFNLVYVELKKNLVLHPLDIRVHLSLAQLAQLGAMINNDGRYIMEAEKFLEDALQISPRRQQIIYALSGVKLQLNKAAESAALLEGAISDNAKISESYWRLAYVYRVTNQMPKVMEVIENALKAGVIFDEREQALVNDILRVAPPPAAKK